MKKSTLAAQGSTGIAVLALLTALAQADTARYSDISALEIDMANAAFKASKTIAGDIMEAELELDDGRALWEIDIVNDANELTTVEVDGNTGQILSIESDEDKAIKPSDAISLAKAIEIVSAIEQGALLEAELDNEHGTLIWEIEALGESDQETTFRIHAETGEILI